MKAADLYERACSNDHMGGCANLALLLLGTPGTAPQETARARELLEKACAAGLTRACSKVRELEIGAPSEPVHRSSRTVASSSSVHGRERPSVARRTSPTAAASTGTATVSPCGANVGQDHCDLLVVHQPPEPGHDIRRTAFSVQHDANRFRKSAEQQVRAYERRCDVQPSAAIGLMAHRADGLIDFAASVDPPLAVERPARRGSTRS